MDENKKEELLAGELFEMMALGWMDEEAKENADSVCQFSSNSLHLRMNNLK